MAAADEAALQKCLSLDDFSFLLQLWMCLPSSHDESKRKN